MTSSLATLSGLLGLSFASGVNLYAAVLVVGLGIRYHWLQGLPPELSPLAHPAILITAAFLYCVEFFADKIPFVSAIWDTIHTFVRPAGAVAIAMTAGSQLGPVEQTLVALVGGTIALTSHATKMGVRLLAHGTGEPVTQAVMSTGEDIFAVTLVILAAQYPYGSRRGDPPDGRHRLSVASGVEGSTKSRPQAALVVRRTSIAALIYVRLRTSDILRAVKRLKPERLHGASILPSNQNKASSEHSLFFGNVTPLK